MTTRRERRRAATLAEIKESALRLLESEGPSGLSIRALARSIDMSPAGLYRYFDGLDALITQLIVDAYNELADAVEAGVATSEPAAEQFAAGAIAYRKWCVANRGRFLLLFGTPIPGYAAPEGGPTVDANRRIGAAFFGVAARGWTAGEIDVPGAGAAPGPADRELAAQIAEESPGFPAELVPVLLGTWAHFHGLVTLEILNQLDWIYPDASSFYEGEVARMVAELTS